jgi:hypothetical protein
MAKFALIQWSSGTDEGKFSVVPINWIIDYNELDNDDDKEWLVEWQTGKKKPASGWSVHDARVLDTSSK